MLDKVKAALRVKTTAFDVEIEGLIAACKADLRLVGINVPEDLLPADGEIPTAGDPLLERAVILYAKANFGYSDDSEKYQNAYDLLKCSLSLAGDYNAVV
jgi:hypothetical protein